MSGSNIHLTGERSREYAARLLTADDPETVAAIVEEIVQDETVEWKPLGDDENNYSDVYTQASSPMPALCELPFNGKDSLTLRHYTEHAEDVDPENFKSMHKAVESDWVDLDDSELELIADGLKPQDGNLLNLTVRDTGKGKAPDEFEDFVSTHAPGLQKQAYPFLQGQYGMGSTGVIRFCGDIEQEINERAYKFIASASSQSPGEWSWTLVHDKPRKGRVEYLTVGGEFPTFDGAFGGALIQKFRERYPDKYDFDANVNAFDPQQHGAFVKVYDYQTNATRSFIAGKGGFRRKLERVVVDSPYPIMLTDMRTRSKAPQSSTSGFLPALRDGREHLLKGEEHITLETESETLGTRDAHVLLFHHDDDLADIETTGRGKNDFVGGRTKHRDTNQYTGIQKDHAVMLTINGQTHASLSEYWLKRIGYSKIAEDTVVIVPFDDLANLGMVNMFSPSRDSLEDSPTANKFLDALKEALKGSDLLSDEEDRRRARRSSETSEVDAETFSSFVEANPPLVKYIATGEQIEAPRIRPSDIDDDELNVPGVDETIDVDAGGPDETDVGGDDSENENNNRRESPRLPTYLQPIEEYSPDGEHVRWDAADGIMTVEVPTNRGRLVRFDTDAQSDYLVRDALSGDLDVTPSEQFERAELQDGLLSVTVSPADDASVGDDSALSVQLTRPNPEDCELFDDPLEAFKDVASGEETPEDIDDTVSADGGSTVDTSPLTATITIEYVEPEEAPDSGPSAPALPDEDHDGGSATDDDGDGENTNDTDPDGDGDGGREAGETQQQTFSMPDIDLVYEEQWRVDEAGNPLDEEEYDPAIAATFDEQRLVEVTSSRDGTISGMGLTVNMDAAALRSFIVEHNITDRWKEPVENRYKLAVVFYTISQYRGLIDEYGEALDGGELMTADIIDASINALGPAIMPTIVSEARLDDISE